MIRRENLFSYINLEEVINSRYILKICKIILNFSYRSCPPDKDRIHFRTDVKKSCKYENSEKKNSKNSEKSEIFVIRKILNEKKDSLLEDETKSKEFEASQIKMKKNLKHLLDYFKEFSKEYFMGKYDFSDFKLEHQDYEKKLNSQNEYNFIRAKSNFELNSLDKSRNNSILKALEIDFKRKFSISFEC